MTKENTTVEFKSFEVTHTERLSRVPIEHIKQNLLFSIMKKRIFIVKKGISLKIGMWFHNLNRAQNSLASTVN